MQVWSLCQEDPLEKEMAAHSSTIAWKIPWTEDPGRLQSTGLQRVGHDWATPLYVEVGCFYAHFLKSFNHKWVLNFVKGFFCIYWDYHMVFLFQCVNMVYHIDWFVYIILGINSTWSWCMSFMICCWILFAKILLRIFANRIQQHIKKACIPWSSWVYFRNARILQYMQINQGDTP